MNRIQEPISIDTAPVMQPGAKVERKSPPVLTTRGKVAKWTGVVAVSALAAIGAREVVKDVGDAIGPNNTRTELSQMDYVNATAMPGEGAESMVRRVEPGVLESAEDRSEVLDYMVNNTGNEDGAVSEGETLQIPVEQGQQVLPGNRVISK